jgi:cell division protease FtsH
MAGDQENQKRNRGGEKRPPLRGSGLVWYLVLAGMAVALAVSLWVSKSQVEIPMGELVRLVKQGSPQTNPQAMITVAEGADGRQEQVRYWQLADLRIGPEQITGTIDRQVIGPREGKVQTGVSFRSDRRGLENDYNRLFDLALEKGFTNVRAEAVPSKLRDFSLVLLLALASGGLLLIVLRRMGGAGSAIAFGRSRGRLYAYEDVGITFDDVAGIDEAVEEVREVVEFLRAPEKYQVLGGRIPKGVLLVGPPGTGKTLLAKAIAGEAAVPFFSLSGSDFVEMFVGVGAARVRDMFQQAQSRAPCIVFIDELDALGKTRGTSVVGGHDEREQTLNALLVEMDGFGSNSRVIIMAATNRPETLDPALLRPGRFDRHVLVDRPDIRGREAILKVHVKEVKLDPSVVIREIAAITPGFVGADLANLVNEAALLAARKNKTAVTMPEFNDGVERVVAGLEKRQRVMQPEEKRRVAYHEAAHALVAFSLPNAEPVHKVSIIPRGVAALGYTMYRPQGDRYLVTQSELESRIQTLLGGTVAEELIFGETSTGGQNDLDRATEVARAMVMDYGMSRMGRITYREDPGSAFLGGPADGPRPRGHSQQTAREIDQEIKRILDESLLAVRRILDSRRPALVALADRLIEKEVIDTDELREVVEAAATAPVLVPGTEGGPQQAARAEPAVRDPAASAAGREAGA